jgi:metallophosphoesterase superfamily enzyme
MGKIVTEYILDLKTFFSFLGEFKPRELRIEKGNSDKDITVLRAVFIAGANSMETTVKNNGKWYEVIHGHWRPISRAELPFIMKLESMWNLADGGDPTARLITVPDDYYD